MLKFSSVQSLMLDHVSTLCEVFSAKITLMRFASQMNPLVIFKVEFFGEGFATPFKCTFQELFEIPSFRVYFKEFVFEL
jgi:hypothetical protein